MCGIVWCSLQSISCLHLGKSSLRWSKVYTFWSLQNLHLCWQGTGLGDLWCYKRTAFFFFFSPSLQNLCQKRGAGGSVFYSCGLQLVQLWVARIIIIINNNIQQSWASLVRVGEISLDVLSEVCLIVPGKITVMVRYEKCIVKCCKDA